MNLDGDFPMLPLNNLIVRVEPRLDGSVGLLMNDIRTWLDHQKIETAGFKPARLDGITLYEVEFQSAAEAALFQTAFAGPPA